MNQNQSILVAGGAGYLGCVLVEELLNRGYAVTVFDRLFFGDHGLHKLRDRIRLVSGDIRAMPPAVLENAGAVINLAGLSNDPTAEYHPEANHQMNTVAAQALAEMARQAGIRRYLYASSCSIYDVGVTDEDRDILLTEEAAVDPHAVYAVSKLAAERAILALGGGSFCPIVLRMGTLFGFSPRMRYDLVVNTFVKDALQHGRLTLHYGGQMWRPLVDVRDAARAHIMALEAPEQVVSGQIFNVVAGNFRISELALRAAEALRQIGVPVEIKTAFQYAGVRNYRVSGKKILRVLNYKPLVSVEESIRHMVENIRAAGYTNFDHDRYYNIRWMKLLEEVQSIIGITGTLFEAPAARSVIEMPAAKRIATA
jgi:nucleoside-diphosphate-sugar epimerase